jgi:hypothetical protein
VIFDPGAASASDIASSEGTDRIVRELSAVEQLAMSWARIILVGAIAVVLNGAASADEILTLGQVDRINWLWLPNDPLDAEAGKRCAIRNLELAENPAQVLRRLGFPKVVEIDDDPDFLLPTFTVYAAAEPAAGTPGRCAISAYATLEMPAPGAEFGFPRVLLWQTPMVVATVAASDDPARPGLVVRATLQGMIEVMALDFIGTWQVSRGP